MAPSTRQECVFPLSYQGQWILFDRNRREKITVTPGEIYFSHLGNFICKATHWQQNVFKLLSVPNNGCRPRYTCVHFDQNTDRSLQFRIGENVTRDLFIINRRASILFTHIIFDIFDVFILTKILAKSTHQDASVKNICQFQDDDTPLADEIRSESMKVMLGRSFHNRRKWLTQIAFGAFELHIINVKHCIGL